MAGLIVGAEGFVFGSAAVFGEVGAVGEDGDGAGDVVGRVGGAGGVPAAGVVVFGDPLGVAPVFWVGLEGGDEGAWCSWLSAFKADGVGGHGEVERPDLVGVGAVLVVGLPGSERMWGGDGEGACGDVFEPCGGGRGIGELDPQEVGPPVGDVVVTAG